MKSKTKSYLGYIIMGVCLIFIGYEWVCGGVLWWWYQDTRTAVVYIIKGCAFLMLYLMILYRTELFGLIKKKQGKEPVEPEIDMGMEEENALNHSWETAEQMKRLKKEIE